MLAFVLAFVMGLTLLARAGDEVAAAQSVISAQQEAFSSDDDAAAYAFAAPALHNYFQSPQSFMFMVRNGYAPVYRHRSFQFGEAFVSDGKITQQVHIIDADGVAWEAIYTLEQQPDGTYKISACVLTKAVIS
jgi:hypothetical protein